MRDYCADGGGGFFFFALLAPLPPLKFKPDRQARRSKKKMKNKKEEPETAQEKEGRKELEAAYDKLEAAKNELMEVGKKYFADPDGYFGVAFCCRCNSVFQTLYLTGLCPACEAEFDEAKKHGFSPASLFQGLLMPQRGERGKAEKIMEFFREEIYRGLTQSRSSPKGHEEIKNGRRN